MKHCVGYLSEDNKLWFCVLSPYMKSIIIILTKIFTVFAMAL